MQIDASPQISSGHGLIDTIFFYLEMNVDMKSCKKL